MSDERKSLGSIYRVTADFLLERGLSQAVLAKATPETRRILEKPPFAFSWQKSEPLEEVERILFDLPDGRDLCAALGRAASLQLCGSVIQGVLRMALSLFGQTPASIFSHADHFYAVVTSGYAFRYEAANGKSGAIWAEIEGGRPHLSLFDQLRGNLSGAYPLCSVSGEVGLPEVLRHDDRGALVKYAVRWD